MANGSAREGHPTLHPHICLSTVGAPSSDHDGWPDVLRRTADLLDRYVEDGPEGDTPHEYNENALRGFVAAAVWAAACGNVALEDYATLASTDDEDESNAAPRRPDLFAHVGDVSYRVEAKRAWLSAWTDSGRDCIADGFRVGLPKVINDAFQQVAPIDEHAQWLGVLLFVVPYTPKADSTPTTEVVERVLEADFPASLRVNGGYRLDWYPHQAFDLAARREREYRCPGMSVIVVFKKRVTHRKVADGT